MTQLISRVHLKNNTAKRQNHLSIQLMKRISLLVLICCSSWGFLAHKTLQQISIYQLPDELAGYFYVNQEYIVQQSIRPDVRRKDDKMEDSKHYLDMDASLFGANYKTDIPHEYSAAVRKYGLDSLRKEGLVPWEVTRVYGRLVHAFKAELRDSVLFYAADLGHYVSDAHVPLHTTKNHDGQLTGQKGMHVLWESLVPEDQLKTYELNVVEKMQYISKPQDFIFEILHESHAMLPAMFLAEKEVRLVLGEDGSFEMVEKYGRKQRYYTKAFIQAYGAKLGKTVQKRMLAASTRVASFWYSAWKDAGSPAWVKQESEVMARLAEERVLWKKNALISSDKLLSVKSK
jgi:hypothetical protein